MKILIPSYRRVHRQTTYDSLCPQVRALTRLVVSPDEISDHMKRRRKVISCPVQGTGMATVRQWMLDWCYENGIEKVLMIDDDLRLQKRREDLKVIGESTPDQQLEMIDWVEKTLDRYDHCAFTERNTAWDDAEEAQEVSKGIQCVGYNVTRIIEETDCRFNKDVPPWFFIEDYHMTLQLFKAGRPNLVSRVYRVNFGPSNADGGCSSHRTPKKMEEAARLLETLHPGIVQAVEKETKTSYGGGVRWNVKVQWKKAFEMSKRKALR